MSIFKKICGKLLQSLLSEKIPDFAAMMYVNLAKNAKTDFYKTVAKEIAEKIESRGDVFNLMDIGTGPGFMLFEIAKIKPYLEMIGVDLSEKLIEFAKCEAEKRIYGNIYFEIGDANHLDFEDNVRDFIISSGVLHSLRNPVAAIKEWLRILKPGHDLWIYDPTVLLVGDEAKDSRSFKKLSKDMEKSLKRKRDRLLFRVMQWLSNLPPKPMTPDYIYTIVQDIGVVESVAVEDRRTYLKIAIKK